MIHAAIFTTAISRVGCRHCFSAGFSFLFLLDAIRRLLTFFQERLHAIDVTLCRFAASADAAILRRRATPPDYYAAATAIFSPYGARRPPMLLPPFDIFAVRRQQHLNGDTPSPLSTSILFRRRISRHI